MPIIEVSNTDYFPGVEFRQHCLYVVRSLWRLLTCDGDAVQHGTQYVFVSAVRNYVALLARSAITPSCRLVLWADDNPITHKQLERRVMLCYSSQCYFGLINPILCGCQALSQSFAAERSSEPAQQSRKPTRRRRRWLLRIQLERSTIKFKCNIRMELGEVECVP